MACFGPTLLEGRTWSTPPESYNTPAPARCGQPVAGGGSVTASQLGPKVTALPLLRLELDTTGLVAATVCCSGESGAVL